LRRARARLEALRERLARQEPRAHLRGLRGRASAALGRLSAWQAAAFRRESLRLERLRGALEPANVTRLLARGFALVLREGHLLTRSASAAEGDPLRIVLGEGWLEARVTGRDAGTDPLPGRGGDRADPAGQGPAGSVVDPRGRGQ
jgi:exodeoxyribonuclease VII large subunit